MKNRFDKELAPLIAELANSPGAHDISKIVSLISNGADLDAVIEDRESLRTSGIWEMVIKTGSAECVQAMINAGADVDKKDPHSRGLSYDYTPLMWATVSGN